MDELDLFRRFRSRVAPPNRDVERRASARLTQAIERRSRPATRVLHRARKRRGAIALAFAALTAVAIASLFVDAPWKSSPGFLERAQAALTPPAGSILHYQWETKMLAESGCVPGSHEIWVDQTPPYAYRLLATNCVGRRMEIGGALETPEILMFVPPNTLSVPDLIFDRPPDPVTALRAAIREGRAHDEGTTQLDGRTVRRIRFEPGCPVPPCSGTGHAYVDPETFFPIREEWPTGYAVVAADGRVYRFDVVVRYLAFEYLPRTAANLALTDIRAQHPDATGP
jgi:hypothetical protein